MLRSREFCVSQLKQQSPGTALHHFTSPILLTCLPSKSSARNPEILISLGWLNRRLILEREAQTYDLQSSSPVSSPAKPAMEMKLNLKG
jgi:hypothetical protein